MSAAAQRASRAPHGDPLRVLVLEPYYGGSHQAVLDGLLERLPVDADVLTLPARKWKWRMRGAAITMAQEAVELSSRRRAAGQGIADDDGRTWDLVYASTFVNLAEFYGLAGSAVADVPAIVYFHENQLVYPNRHEAEWDFQFPLTNITSALTADACLFNSEFTMETFLTQIDPFLKRFPDHRPKHVTERIRDKSSVVPPPFDAAPFDRALGGAEARSATRGERPLIVWPHRWEHDKDPETFMRSVRILAEEGLEFEVAVAGQSFRDVPASIGEAREVLGERLVHLGEPDSRDAYASLLARADISVSTATNEFFGLAMMESAYAGCYPLVPDRLAYPELYPERFRYRDEAQLVATLRTLIQERPAPGAARAIAQGFTFDEVTPAYAQVFDRVSREHRRI